MGGAAGRLKFIRLFRVVFSTRSNRMKFRLGGGRSTKKKSRKGKLNEKNSCTPINPKKYSCCGLKKIHTRNLITKKSSCGSKIPLPPPPHKTHNFSNGPSLSRHTSSTTREHTQNAGVWENRKGFLTYNPKNDYERTLNKKELSISSLEIF